MALKITDRRKTGEPLPDSHPLKKGALICCGNNGLKQQAAFWHYKRKVEDAIAALLAADKADVDACITTAKEAINTWTKTLSRFQTEEPPQFKRLDRWNTSLSRFHPEETRPIEQLVRLERVSDDLLTGAEIDILERMAFERMCYGRKHGGGLHGGRYIK